MTEAERLAERLLDLVSNFTKPSYRNTLTDSAALIRSQAEELERLRGALGELSDYETDRASMWADQHNEWTKDEMHKIARAALGEAKAAPEQEQA